MLKQFLGFDRVASLGRALRRARQDRFAVVPTRELAGVLLFVAYCGILVPSHGVLSRYDTALILILTLIGMFLWHRGGRPARPGFAESIKQIHTAFALGVIPAIGILVLSPESLGTQWSGGASGEMQSGLEMLAGVVLVSLFAGITEEVFFRGVFVSTLRRMIGATPLRDALAICLPAIIFGLLHGIDNGIVAGVALTGIGVGLGVGYVASGENLGGVVFYHVAFDFLSLLVPLLSIR